LWNSSEDLGDIRQEIAGLEKLMSELIPRCYDHQHLDAFDEFDEISDKILMVIMN
jgi:hypothetical protein